MGRLRTIIRIITLVPCLHSLPGWAQTTLAPGNASGKEAAVERDGQHDFDFLVRKLGRSTIAVCFIRSRDRKQG